ncbi:MAG: TlpA family protein disulfide reductase [Cyclobacteriaceae bacterium]|nr:TlpA family protein disulfide reductase [Cyclobacteriaceae bacterium]
MKQFLTTLVCILIAVNLPGQDNCFNKCIENLEKSTLSTPEKQMQILQGLIGCKAPVFNVNTIKGETLKLNELTGKVVVINFWFEGCAPCIAELPALNKLYEDYKTKDVVFIAFGKDDTQTIMDFLKRRDFNFNHVSSDYDLSNDYCIIAGWPTNMVLDKNGTVRQIFSGGLMDERAKTHAYDKMKPTIEQYLSLD